MGATSAQHVSDVAIIGDGPAGSALASACVNRGVSTLLIGGDDPWSATYGSWVDDLDGTEWFGPDLFASRVDSVVVHTTSRLVLDRPYGVLDNERLRSALRRGVAHRTALAAHVERSGTTARIVMSEGRSAVARLVVDATGWPPSLSAPAGGVRASAFQTAFGVVIGGPPSGEFGEPVLMDFRAVGSDGDQRPTFCYSLPVAGGWMVEETVLAASVAVDPTSLRERLAERLGTTVTRLRSDVLRTEVVRIPMGVPLPDADRQTVAFGAAAGYVHPATGYSVASSMRAAGRVADRIADVVSSTELGTEIASRAVWDAVWPRSLRRTRVLHDHGLDVIVGMGRSELAEFFGCFFALPSSEWGAFLRIDSAPLDVSRLMVRLFCSAPASLRRRLLATTPRRVSRLLRP